MRQTKKYTPKQSFLLFVCFAWQTSKHYLLEDHLVVSRVEGRFSFWSTHSRKAAIEISFRYFDVYKKVLNVILPALSPTTLRKIPVIPTVYSFELYSSEKATSNRSDQINKHKNRTGDSQSTLSNFLPWLKAAHNTTVINSISFHFISFSLFNQHFTTPQFSYFTTTRATTTTLLTFCVCVTC